MRSGGLAAAVSAVVGEGSPGAGIRSRGVLGCRGPGCRSRTGHGQVAWLTFSGLGLPVPRGLVVGQAIQPLDRLDHLPGFSDEDVVLLLGLPASNTGEIEVALQVVDLLEQPAQFPRLPSELGLVGGGIEGMFVPRLAEECVAPGECQVLYDPGGDPEKGFGASGGRAFETQTPDLRGPVLVLDRDPERSHVACQLAQHGIAFLAGQGEPGSVAEDSLVECYELSNRATEPGGEAVEQGARRREAGGRPALLFESFEIGEEVMGDALPFEDGFRCLGMVRCRSRCHGFSSLLRIVTSMSSRLPWGNGRAPVGPRTHSG